MLLILASVLVLSCTTVEHGTQSLSSGEESSGGVEYAAPLVYGRGEGATIQEAENAALRDGARTAAEVLLGPGAVVKNQEILDRLFSEAMLPDVRKLYIENSITAFNTEETAGSTAVIRGELDLSVLMDYLRKEGLPEELLPESAEAAGLQDAAVPDYARKYFSSEPKTEKPETPSSVQDIQEADAVDIDDFARLRLNDDEKDRLVHYLSNLSFMIHSRDSSDEGGVYKQEASLELSRLLVRYGYTCLDPEQVDEILESQQETYREETGGDVPLLQWTAQKLGSSMYAAVDSQIDTRREADGYYASAKVSVDLIDPWSWENVDSLSSRESPPAFSTVSEEEAASFALRSVLLDLVPDIISSARESYGNSLVKGISYELVLLNPPDQRELKRFIGELEDHVRRIRRLSASAAEVRYELRFLGDVEDLESLLYEIASGIESFEDFSPAYQRGSELAFYAGLF